jgi:hypothetical protein
MIQENEKGLATRNLNVIYLSLQDWFTAGLVIHGWPQTSYLQVDKTKVEKNWLNKVDSIVNLSDQQKSVETTIY